MGDFLPGLILNDDAVAGGAGIAAGAAVAVGDEIVLGRIFAVRVLAMGKKRFGSGAAGRRHALEFTTAVVRELAAGGEARGQARRQVGGEDAILRRFQVVGRAVEVD